MSLGMNKKDISITAKQDISVKLTGDTVVCYCGANITPSMLKCSECQKLFHLTCLKKGRPSNFKADIFFEFTCVNCSDTGEEKCKRKLMNWLQVVYLALYNLICGGSGRKGYFRWKDDLCQFIEQHWNIFHAHRKKTLSWCSTVAGTLSANCPKIFKSGLKEFKEGGWWTLQEVLPPSEKPEVMTPGFNLRRKKKGGPVRRGDGGKIKKRKVESENLENGETGESAGNHEAGTLVETENVEGSENMVGGHKIQKSSVSETDIADQISTFLESNGDFLQLDIGDFGAIDEIFDNLDHTNDTLLSSFVNDHDENKTESKMDDGEQSSTSKIEQESVIILDPKDLSCSQSSTSTTEKSKKDDSDNDDDDDESSQAKNLRTLQPHEQRLLLEKLNKIDSQDPKARRLRRKLLLNNQKRQCGLSVFDLDQVIGNSINTVSHYVLENGECSCVLKPSSENTEARSEVVNKPQRTTQIMYDRILDRFMLQPVSQKPVKQVSFLGRLIGCNSSAVNRVITSPYTSRVLKPFIRRDFEATPLKLKVLKEIYSWFQRKFPNQELSPAVFGSIDYCYVQPHHIPGVNALCREFFWPGIDLSECLQYPDFTCVVLYKKLIIGCAFMVPDVKCNEAYISFVVVHPDWRSAGIGSFMIYHLIQTCLGKDVTLHVSANNPAMLLYQKFGFKPERFVVGFYDRYYPSNGEHSKHAFFLRLQR